MNSAIVKATALFWFNYRLTAISVIVINIDPLNECDLQIQLCLSLHQIIISTEIIQSYQQQTTVKKPYVLAGAL